MLEHDTLDAVLLDWNLPELSGIEVLREVRESLRSRVPIIFVTARDQERDIVSALTAGADDFLVKPVRRLELLARIDAAARRGGGPPLEGGVFEVGPFPDTQRHARHATASNHRQRLRRGGTPAAQCRKASLPPISAGDGMGNKGRAVLALFGYARQPRSQDA